MKHCVLVTTSFPAGGPPGAEAAGAFVRDFAESLAAFADVTVVAPSAGTGTSRDGSTTVAFFRAPRMPLSLLDPRRPRDWGAIATTLRSGAATVARVVAERPTAHVLALWALPCGYWARRAGVPYSTWALGSDIWVLGRIPLIRAILGGVLRDATFRFADGEQLRLDVERLGGRPCEFLASARQLPCPPRTGPAAQPPYKLAFLARWHPNKGADILIESLLALDDEDWKLIAEVRLAGGGPLATVMETGVARLRAVGRPVTLEGFLGAEAAAGLLSWADWLLLPSRIESIPVIFSDALQAGCAVLSNPAGDLAQLVEGLGVGLCAARADVESFTALIRRGLRTSPAAHGAAIAAAGERFNVVASARAFAARAGFATDTGR